MISLNSDSVQGMSQLVMQFTLSSGDLANREIDDLLEQSQRMEAVYKEIPTAPITAAII